MMLVSLLFSLFTENYNARCGMYVRPSTCAVELYHVPHLWYPPFYTSTMVSSALQH